MNPLPPTFENILSQTSLKWIFVGGKGGVGKTTISTSLSILLSQHRSKVLIISTDPAHNLSDAFNQKLSSEPTLVKPFTNLYAMEIDPHKEEPNIDKFNELLGMSANKSPKDFLKNLKASVPGVDEALNLRYIATLANNNEYDVVVFDTAPTGHTLRLLELPNVLGKSLEKMIQIKSQFTSVLDGIGSMLNGFSFDSMFDKLFSNLNELRKNLSLIAEMFTDPDKTTFIAVAIPEFLSVYETERLINSLFDSGIDIRNVVVNQVLWNDNDDKSKGCRMCNARRKMQGKYIQQIKEMYDDFHIVMCPLQKQEIRGEKELRRFAGFLMDGKVI